MKILTVIGARPQFIKAAVVSRALKQAGVQEVIVHTGQHFDKNMSEIFFREMQIPHPNEYLAIQGLSHGAMTGRMLEKIEKVLIQEEPDWVLVYGDTNSTLAGALAASKLEIKIAHVEAGLRSFNMSMPEEQNRILTDRLSTVLFCPTEIAVKNLYKEGFDHFPVKICNVGDVMYDGAMFYSKVVEGQTFESIPRENYVLVTCHRAENTDDESKMKNIVGALNELAQKTKVILPLHPRTKKKIADYGLTLSFNPLEPVGYLEMLALLKKCCLVMTDSGGLQKEAYFFEKPCVTMRDETEWGELVESGVNKLAGSDKNKILEAYEEVLQRGLSFPKNLYGDAQSANKIVQQLLEFKEI